MKELQEILARIKTLEPNESAILATVVDVKGSSYRLPGAKMLILESGTNFGTVSGGCLEADVLERAKQVLKTGEPQVLTYDTRTNDDSVFALNMGCNGVVRILLERVSGENSYLEFLKNCVLSYRGSGIAATLISAHGENQTGARLLFGADIILESDLTADLQAKLLPDLKNIFVSESSQLKTYDDAEVFIELLKPTVSLFIFGAGADAIPLCDFAKNLGWSVEVLDHRPAFATEERFPQADFVNVLPPDKFWGFTPSVGNYFAVVMTHNYEKDKEIIWRLLNTNAKYIGALGPKRRTENILRELEAEGKEFPAENLQKLYAPVGLDIGADTPESIALSIVAEINSVLAGREGGFLKNRQGSIYNRNCF